MFATSATNAEMRTLCADFSWFYGVMEPADAPSWRVTGVTDKDF